MKRKINTSVRPVQRTRFPFVIDQNCESAACDDIVIVDVTGF